MKSNDKQETGLEKKKRLLKKKKILKIFEQENAEGKIRKKKKRETNTKI